MVLLYIQVKDGLLVATNNVQLATWLPLLPLATDVHAEAATLTYAHAAYDPQQREAAKRTLRVTLTRAVKAGETPPLWFSSEVAAQLGLPFLNFSHIRSKLCLLLLFFSSTATLCPLYYLIFYYFSHSCPSVF